MNKKKKSRVKAKTSKAGKAGKGRVKAKVKARAKVAKVAKTAKPKVNGAESAVLAGGPKPSSKDAQRFELRWRTIELRDRVKAAAVRAGMSANTYMNEVLEKAAEATQ
jgi:hypothetical protein